MKVLAPASPFSQGLKAVTWPAPPSTAWSFSSAGSNVAMEPPPVSFQQHDHVAAAYKKSHTIALKLAALVSLGSMISAGMHMYSAGPSSDAVRRCGYTSVAEWRAYAAGVIDARARLHAMLREYIQASTHMHALSCAHAMISEEWRFSADSKGLDMTFLEASATSDARSPPFLPIPCLV